MTRTKHSTRLLIGMAALMMSVGPMASAAESQANLNTGSVMVWLKEHAPHNQGGKTAQRDQRASQRRSTAGENLSTGSVIIWLKDWIEGHF